jgi:hypothetical protein
LPKVLDAVDAGKEQSAVVAGLNEADAAPSEAGFIHQRRPKDVGVVERAVPLILHAIGLKRAARVGIARAGSLPANMLA